jgi:hypothetical protein
LSEENATISWIVTTPHMSGIGKGDKGLGETNRKRTIDNEETGQKKPKADENQVVQELQPVEVSKDIFSHIFNYIPVNNMVSQQLYTINKQTGTIFNTLHT